MNRLIVLPVLLAISLLTLPANALDASTGKARIIDGDTIEVAGIRFRLKGIDAPERRQECLDYLQRPFDCGAAAVRTLVKLTKGQKVTCEPVRRDRFRRKIGVCRLPSGLNLNIEMLRQGQAVAFGRSLPDYAAAEKEARRAGAGLWAGTFEHPGCWRSQQRGNECLDRLSTD
jgi:endonuclease YncB( thermonuclease family)